MDNNAVFIKDANAECGVPAPYLNRPGPMKIVVGGNRMCFTSDYYKTFIELYK